METDEKTRAEKPTKAGKLRKKEKNLPDSIRVGVEYVEHRIFDQLRRFSLQPGNHFLLLRVFFTIFKPLLRPRK